MPILINNPRLLNYYNKFRPILRDAHASAYFMLIFSLLSLSFFGAFAIRPTIATITQLQREIADSQEAYQKLQEKNKNLLLLQAEYKRIEPDLPIVYDALPNQVNAPTFLLKLRTLAVSNNLQIANSQIAKSPLFEEQDGQPTVILVPFSLTASGNYKNINNFLMEIASLDRIATFGNIGITASSTTGSPDSLTLQLTGNIYTLFD